MCLAVDERPLRPWRGVRPVVVETDRVDRAERGHLVSHRSGRDGHVGKERRDGGPHHVGHAADAGPALERDRRLLDEHLGAIGSAQATRRAAASNGVSGGT